MLGSLRYIGRGWAFDDLEEAIEESHRVFSCFCESLQAASVSEMGKVSRNRTRNSR